MTTLESLARECGQMSDHLWALVAAGEAVPPNELQNLLGRAKRLHVQMQMEMGGAIDCAVMSTTRKENA